MTRLSSPADHACPLENRVALVTGASAGIGRASALELARRGARVVIAARREAELAAVLSDIEREGHTGSAIVCDVTREDDIARMMAFVLERYGRLDIAFNNAGAQGEIAPIVELDRSQYDVVFDTNVRAVFHCMQREAEIMLAQGSGSIINNASMAAVIDFENASLYVATKHAIAGMTKTASVEWFRRGVCANALAPGLIATDFNSGFWPSDEARQSFAAATPAGRFGTAEEMAGIVAFLASDDSTYVSGHVLVADGGYSIT